MSAAALLIGIAIGYVIRRTPKAPNGAPQRFRLFDRTYVLTSISGPWWKVGEDLSGPLTYTYHPDTRGES